jgi:hypothetical protein
VVLDRAMKLGAASPEAAKRMEQSKDVECILAIKTRSNAK